MMEHMPLIKYPHPSLSKQCSDIVDFTDPRIGEILDEMRGVMLANNGLGLAANQIDYCLNMFIMLDRTTKTVHEFINPELVFTQGTDFASFKEGCLSLPGIEVFIPGRYNEVLIQYQDRSGEKKSGVAIGLEAVCAQHEYDHLQGKFFIDKLPRKERRTLQKQLGLK